MVTRISLHPCFRWSHRRAWRVLKQRAEVAEVAPALLCHLQNTDVSELGAPSNWILLCILSGSTKQISRYGLSILKRFLQRNCTLEIIVMTSVQANDNRWIHIFWNEDPQICLLVGFTMRARVIGTLRKKVSGSCCSLVWKS